MFTKTAIQNKGEKANAPQEALGTGCGGTFFPDFPNEFPDFFSPLTEYKLTLPGCVGCDKVAPHGPPCSGLAVEIPFGQHSRRRIDRHQKITAEEMVRLFSAAAVTGYVMHGNVGFELIFNVGLTANNGVNAWQYEIMSISEDGLTLTLKGPNPKRLQYTLSVPNPEWIPGVNARLLSQGIALAMPLGSEVRFLAPSVLENKVRPLVQKINLPASNAATATFSVELTHSAKNAKQHFDGGVPNPPKWYCQIRYEASAPAAWPNWQAQRETQWVKRTAVYTSATLTATPVQALKNTAGNDTRVVMAKAAPWFEGVALRVVLNRPSGETRILTEAQTAAILTVTQSGSGWVSTLDLTAYREDIEDVTVTYWCEAVSGNTGRQVWNGACANSQRDFSGSYAMNDGHFCTAIDCDQRANYRADCWQPNASRFCVGSRVGAGIDTGRMVLPPNDIVEGEWMSMLWTRASWMLVQSMVGITHASLQRPSRGGTSIMEWMGGFNLTTGGGAFPFKERLAWSRGKVAGRLKITNNSDGVVATLVHGAFLAAEQQNAAGVIIEGSLHDENDWSDRKNERLATMTENESVYPSGAVGNTGVYSGQTGGERMGTRSRLSAASREVHVTNMRIDGDEDVAVSAKIRERFI